jgi:hypothetical protein
MKTLWKKCGIEEKLDVISYLIKAEWIADISCNVRFAHCSICTIHDNADRITGTEVFV